MPWTWSASTMAYLLPGWAEVDVALGRFWVFRRQQTFFFARILLHFTAFYYILPLDVQLSRLTPHASPLLPCYTLPSVLVPTQHSHLLHHACIAARRFVRPDISMILPSNISRDASTSRLDIPPWRQVLFRSSVPLLHLSHLITYNMLSDHLLR
ncbi:hypothetical protein BGZ60DRAFT_19847 [Tricladium varicosporioides]|nr:hypothetical protein BGZ60DRAFT_19847 [Hymenoscyphus varicosporioides]